MVNGERSSLLASVFPFGGSPGVYLLPVWFVCLPAIQVAQLLHLNLPRPSPSCLGQSASLLCPGSRSNFSIKSFCPLSLHSSASFQTVCECVCVCVSLLSVAFISTLSLSRLGLSRTAASPTLRMHNIWPWQT